MTPPSLATLYRSTVVLLWALVAYDTIACRGLFWDGTSFLANMLEYGSVHDFYPARAHVNWVTQVPVLLLAKLGVRDVRLLAMVFTAALFGLPTGLYHFALHRLRHDGTLLAAGIGVIAAIYLPTSFFIIGEYNATYAAAMAIVAVVLTSDGASRLDSLILAALGVLCIASYEAMIYLGPLLIAAVLWWMSRGRRAAPQSDDITQLLGFIAVVSLAAGVIVSSSAVIEYWNNNYFIKVRAATFDFWQNLQFIVPLIGLGVLTLLTFARPAWLASGWPIPAVAAIGAILISTLWFRQIFQPEAMIFPPAHYVARTAAGGLLWAVMAAMWVYAVWRDPPALLAILHRREVGRRLATAMFVLTLCAAVPDVVLTRMWTNYLDYFHGIVTSRTGLVRAKELPLETWPYRLFAQDWSYPALSALLRARPGQGVVVMDKTYKINPPFEPSCGTVPRLEGYSWPG
ncbi:MAG TPA: hypothetical protein VMI56_06645 [Reyranella sp.]|nr:hypothetical protein [Reyranella sp.]